MIARQGTIWPTAGVSGIEPCLPNDKPKVKSSMNEIAINDSAFTGEVTENTKRKGPRNVKRRSAAPAAMKMISKKVRIASAICCELNIGS